MLAAADKSKKGLLFLSLPPNLTATYTPKGIHRAIVRCAFSKVRVNSREADRASNRLVHYADRHDNGSKAPRAGDGYTALSSQTNFSPRNLAAVNLAFAPDHARGTTRRWSLRSLSRPRSAPGNAPTPCSLRVPVRAEAGRGLTAPLRKGPATAARY